MKTTTAHTKEVWQSGDFAGETRRATTRVTIQRMSARAQQYRLEEERSRSWAHSGTWVSMMFGQEENRPRELFNIKSVNWSRGVDADVGTCKIVLANVEVRNDLDPVSAAELDFPGYYTPNRGTETYFDQWGYVANEWKDWLQPDRLIRTYEGYGSDRTVAPEHDPYLYPSGVWLIDDVTIDTGGYITLDCRDVGRVLLEQVLFAPLVPWQVYPLTWEQFEDRAKPQQAVAGTWETLSYDTDSNIPYIGSGITDNGQPVVASDGTVYQHHGRDAFDGETADYWLSVGKRSNKSSDAYEYIQGELASPGPVQGVKVNAQHGPYQMFVSLQKADGTWVGKQRVPYKAGAVNTHANVPYVAAFTVKKGEIATFKLPRVYTGIKKIRYTFTTAWSGYGDKLLFHSAINEVYYAPSVTMQTVAGTWKNGNYGDYSTIVKWLVSWGGFFWPNAVSGLNTITYSDGSQQVVAPASNDPALVDGRAWGDFEQTGTAGTVPLGVDVWDKKPIMDGIGVIREIVGFDFWIDETGGVVWRLPNIWSKGCYVMPTFGGPRASRTSSLVTIDERTTLIDMQVKLSSRNVRERIYVGNTAGHIGAIVSGFRPDNVGLRRYAGWTDQRFGTTEECERMADLIALKQEFLYRQNNLTIVANPSLQPDDQVIIVERMTGEGYIHRIISIDSAFDNETGQWTYALTTNWLGSQAFTNLAWDPNKLTNATKVYLHFMGKL